MDVNDRLISVFVIVGTIVFALIALMVIVVSTLLPLISPDVPIPKALENWGGLIIGFFCGSFASLVGGLAKTRPKSGEQAAIG
jgi:hypothetical protein